MLEINEKNIVGGWVLKEHSQFNERVRGILIYSPDSSMSVLIHGPLKKTSSEALVAYSGRFKIKASTIEHHIEVSDRESRVGNIEIREANLNGIILILSALSADGEIVKVVWEKRDST